MPKIGKILYKCKTKNGDIFFMQAENSVKVFCNEVGHLSRCGKMSNQEYESLMAKKDKKEEMKL